MRKANGSRKNALTHMKEREPPHIFPHPNAVAKPVILTILRLYDAGHPNAELRPGAPSQEPANLALGGRRTGSRPCQTGQGWSRVREIWNSFYARTTP